MRSVLVLAASIGLTACAPQYMWVKQGATSDDFERDKNLCVYEAKLATASYSQGATPRSRSAAFAQGFGEGLTMALRENELATLCMQTKGYVQVPIGSAPPPSAYSPPPTAYVPPAASTDRYRVVLCSIGDKFTYIREDDCRSRGGTWETRTEPPIPQAATTQATAPQVSSKGQPGQYSFEAEKVARAEQCSAAPVASMTAKGPGFESYNVLCSNGDALAVRCDLGNCRALK